MAELLIELFSEEIPARMQARAADDLQRLVCEQLTLAELTYTEAQAFATPRRLTLVVDGLQSAQPDTREERRGPRVGAPDQAIDGFLRSTGLGRDQLEERETDKGRFYFAVIERKGLPTQEVVAGFMPDVLTGFPWPKSMRWGSGDLRWVRPLQSILCLFDGAVVAVDVGVPCGRTTRGHRFMAPDVIEVTDFKEYVAKLRAAKVILDPVERRRVIADGVTAAAEAAGYRYPGDDALVHETAGLAEWPVVLTGTIDAAFMDLPPEAPTTAMRNHQRYFALEAEDGRLAPRFAVVANLETADGGKAIVAGNERVLRARLHDAKFFWDQDRKVRLEDRVPALFNIVFNAALGTVGAKVERVQALAGELCDNVTGANRDRARSAALLAKADLTTGMVGEFPELQGIMGRYYALAEGERADVADAIAAHYSPQGPNDRCPTEPLAVVVALADKADTLAGFFAIDERPTGSKDPYALRRAALGIIRLIIENGLRISLRQLFARALALYEDCGVAPADKGAVLDGLIGFFADRLKVHLRERGIRHDLVAAVFAVGEEDDPVRLLAKVDALKAFLDSEDGANLLTAYRRAGNIVRIEEKKDGATYDQTAEATLLDLAEEHALFERLTAARETITTALETEDFAAAMGALATLRAPVDAFFDRVTVNCDDPGLRRNRLRLLSGIRSALGSVADFSIVEG
ncbi:MAG: glycine--tRNA ligase subunit beta [Rhodospirillaceae bacterium]|nr:glycine--tRNA ligase subunit beta [Rhodospirillaceae bacterium]